jgi:hypothetical protein
MTRRVPLPTAADVEQARTAILAEAAAGRRPSVVALARRLGLTNATFWRHLPDIARQVANQRRTLAARTIAPAASAGREAQLASLRRTNRNLTENLALAAANIQRLSLENEALRRELGATRNVMQLRTTR